jgi:trans-AT polyketide synthase, acyltransferase and oxidoreductase domains
MTGVHTNHKIVKDPAIINHLKDTDKGFYITEIGGRLQAIPEVEMLGKLIGESQEYIPPISVGQFGDEGFRKTYGVDCAFYAGAMANAIASAEMVIALGKHGLMGSFGAAGLIRSQLESVVDQIQAALPNGPYAFNLINSPNEEALERNAVEVYLSKGVTVIEASAYLDITSSLVVYRAAGLKRSQDGVIDIGNHIIAKLSRSEVAIKFLQPAPEKMLAQLVSDGRISKDQADMARDVPMADDITIEGDSGGHTDNRPLICLLPSMLALRDEMQAKYQYQQPIRIGAAGGISTPASALAAFMMGAAYIVTGSVNQACVESGASPHTKKLLSEAGMADVAMAPSADMFEMGVKVQVLKRGTLFPMRATKLYEIYTRYDSIESIPPDEREKLEKQVFQRSLDSIWEDTVKFFTERDPVQIENAAKNPKRKMALIFRWYLGLSSRWSNSGETGREMDYQIWCGPSMGSFNDWTRSTYMAKPENRHIVDVTLQLFAGAAWHYRTQQMKMQGLLIPSVYENYYPSSAMGE